MSTTILTLEHAGASIALRLEPDPERARRALAHGAGHALSHAGSLDGPLRELVLGAAQRFGSGDRGTATEAIERLRAVIAQLAPDARLAIAAEVAGERGLPRWPSTLRTGPPSPAGRGIWPFDAELAGLRLGLRRIVKRECFSDEAAIADRAWLESNGVRVRAAGGPDADGRRILFGALDDARLGAHLADAERDLRARRDPDAIRRLGTELGYPRCCVDAFVTAGAQDDLSLVATRLPAVGHAPAPPHSQWLNQPLAIISHVPCSLDCAATIDLATALVGELDRAYPGFAAAWQSLARRVHLITRDGRALALAGSGSPAAGFTLTHAVELNLPGAADLSDLAADAPDLIGRTLTITAGIVTDGADLSAVAVADHTRL